MNRDEILGAVENLRLDLPKLIGPQAEVLSKRLTQAVEQGESKPDADLLNVVVIELKEFPIALDKFEVHLMGGGKARGFSFDPMPGRGTPISSDRFVCPEPGCDRDWSRQRLGQQPPRCDMHDKELIPEAEKLARSDPTHDTDKQS